eukprot:CAMPEP_0172534142 /NCGR_PEP_ID=MMETSP1067-20121228/6612_1 /TAXON_ID=265564 ORGANISM="Thalassiosira punctigera, Strain Tpunct2005C2" /NCGR_SAMPLE_ID=MMETSP1067 /ASSEMBLY_ACC=CAM_ASM_000444 /LENGTH=290 /DNA_ID=CAMNT_0013318893 /DNA_START=16 /DNA_END=888 /DNA_ORIENTATION=-
MCKPSGADSFYARAGNAGNVSVLLASLLYVAVVIRYTQPGQNGVLDELWKEDGFCVHNREVPYWSSFDTCLYVDVAFSAVLGSLYFKWRGLPGMGTGSEIVPMVILGTLGHGIAHGAMAMKFRDGSYEEEKARGVAEGAREETLTFVQMALFCGLFWFPLLKASMFKINSAIVAVIAMAVTFLPEYAGGIKKELGFAYVQTVLAVAFNLSQLLGLSPEEKMRREYAMMPLLGAIPLLVAWNEALFCGSYFKAAGGHVLYDASIIVGYIVFYLDCYRVNVLPSRGGKQKMT